MTLYAAELPTDSAPAKRFKDLFSDLATLVNRWRQDMLLNEKTPQPPDLLQLSTAAKHKNPQLRNEQQEIRI